MEAAGATATAAAVEATGMQGMASRTCTDSHRDLRREPGKPRNEGRVRLVRCRCVLRAPNTARHTACGARRARCALHRGPS